MSISICHKHFKKKKKISHIHIAQKKLAEAAVAAGWEEVEYFDMSNDLRCSFLVMGRKVTEMLESGKYDDGAMFPVLKRFEENLYARVDQVCVCVYECVTL